MSADSKMADLTQAGLALVELGLAIGRGELPDPAEVAKTLSAIAVALVPVDDMKGWLDDADRRRIDTLVDIDVRAKLGPRP